MKKREAEDLLKQRDRHKFSLLALIICTTANIFIFILQVLKVKIKLYIPYSILLVNYSLQLGNSGSIETGEYYKLMLGVLGASVILGAFFALYLWSEKNNKAFLVAIIIYLIDTAVVAFEIKMGNNYAIVDFAFHFWALYSLIMSYTIGKQLNINNISNKNIGGNNNVKGRLEKAAKRK